MTLQKNVILKELATEGSCLGRHGNRPLQFRCNKIDSSITSQNDSVKNIILIYYIIGQSMPGGQSRPPLRLPTFRFPLSAVLLSPNQLYALYFSLSALYPKCSTIYFVYVLASGHNHCLCQFGSGPFRIHGNTSVTAAVCSDAIGSANKYCIRT